jgi:hypothetical protein
MNQKCKRCSRYDNDCCDSDDKWKINDLTNFTKCTPNFSKWAIHHLKPLKTYAERRVLLLGDAVCFSDLCFIISYLFA